MEYYDSINNQKLYLHYFQKNNNMLNNQEVIQVLDKLGADSSKTHIKIFENETPYQMVKNDSFVNGNKINYPYKKNSMVNQAHRESMASMRDENVYNNIRKQSYLPASGKVDFQLILIRKELKRRKKSLTKRCQS